MLSFGTGGWQEQGWLMTGHPSVCQPMTTTGSVSRHTHSFVTSPVIANPFIPPSGSQ